MMKIIWQLKEFQKSDTQACSKGRNNKGTNIIEINKEQSRQTITQINKNKQTNQFFLRRPDLKNEVLIDHSTDMRSCAIWMSNEPRQR